MPLLPKMLLGITALASANDRTPVILIADVGVDDASALIWLAKDPTIDLLGVAASFGCHGDVRQTAANARRVLRAAGGPSGARGSVDILLPLSKHCHLRRSELASRS